eukprot:evm.model.scf_227.6 EVM.evm.TU.scf_227.6   scf_227:67170-78839(-)
MGDVERTSAPDLELDDKTQSGFITWFKNLPEDPRVIRIFDRSKGIYSVHGENAIFVARQFYKTTAVVKDLGSGQNSLPAVTLNRSLLETVLRELLVETAEYGVELYEGRGASWELARSASPGKLDDFEEEIFRTAEVPDVPVVIAVSTSFVDTQRLVGVAFINMATRQMGACEFHDDDQYCCLETLVVQLGAKECVIPKESDSSPYADEIPRIQDVMSRCTAMSTLRPKSIFATKNLEQDLSRLVKSGSVEQHRDVLDRSMASSALAAIIAFSEVLCDASHHGKFSLGLHDMGQFMRLDAAAQRALNVMPNRFDENNMFSLYGLMNRAKTPMGRRKLKVWLKQPLVDVSEIDERLDAVEAFFTDEHLRQRMRSDYLRGMPDVERLTRKLDRKRVTLADLCHLYRASSKLPLIEAVLRRHDEMYSGSGKLCAKYADILSAAHSKEWLTKFEQLIEAAIDLERVPEEFWISSSYDERLEKLQEERQECEEHIEAIAAAAAKDLGLLLNKTVKLEWHKVYSTKTRCLRITQKDERIVRKKLQASYTLLETRKDGTKFTNSKLKAAAEQLQAVSGEYQEIQAELVTQVVEVAHTFVEIWEQVGAILGELDVLAGFADLAASAPCPYIRPTVLPPDSGELILRGSRHPCVEAQDGLDFIKNDCEMVHGKSWFQIITGPNMGGKSTFIRQVGTIVLMAQVGSFVPCDEARIAARDCIFARVGAGDCQLRGVSTFMAEMLETASILKGATEKSLIIIDELGRGTSTYDGFGLAWAISEHIMEIIGAPTLFATHFHELTAIQGSVGVKNMHVETTIDEHSGKLTMLYQVSEGACDQSFGIHVAEFAQFPPVVVELAKRKLEELEGTAGQVRPDGKTSCQETASNGMFDAQARGQKFLDDLKAINLDLPDADLMQQAQALLCDLEADAAKHPCLQKMIAGASL